MILILEGGFSDTVSVQLDGKLLVKQYMETTTAGIVSWGGIMIDSSSVGKIVIQIIGGVDRQFKISVVPHDNTPFKLKTTNDCTQFNLKAGYKYFYINRYLTGEWRVVYSNYNRMYY
jgi:hypothetical protein